MPARDFRYQLLSIGVNREANGATVRSAERDAFGISWTFAQLGYWRAERNRCLTGTQASPQAVDAHLASCARLDNLDLLLVFWSGYLFTLEPIVETLAAAGQARLRVLIVDTCHAEDRMRRLEAVLAALLDTFNRAADETVGRLGREPLFVTNGIGHLRLPLLAQPALPFEPA
jgi:hypothetical protein